MPEPHIIPHDTFLRLLGLLTLAADHRKALEDIERSACKLLGQAPGGHVGDEVWGGIQRGAKGLVAVLNIQVQPPEEDRP